jgi:hypothetical protein
MCGRKLTRANSGHTLAPYSSKVRFNSVLPSSLCEVVWSRVLVNQILYFFPPVCATCPLRRIVLDLIARRARAQILKPFLQFYVVISFCLQSPSVWVLIVSSVI